MNKKIRSTKKHSPKTYKKKMIIFGQNFAIPVIVCCMMLLALRRENLSIARFDEFFSAWRPPRKSRSTLTEIASSVDQDNLSDHSVFIKLFIYFLKVCQPIKL